MTYEVEIAEKALKALKKLPKKDRQRIESHIDILSIDPRPSTCKKLVGKRSFYRIRSGNYRVVYTIKDDILLVLVVEIGHRKEVYR